MAADDKAADDKLSTRIEKGTTRLRGIGREVAKLEADLHDARNAHAEAEGRCEELWRDLEGAREAERLVEALEDVRRGVRTLDELFEEFCTPVLSMAA